MSKIRRDLKRIARDLRAVLKREVADIIAIGDLLNEAKEQLLEHGEWLDWLAENFGSSSTADNYRNAARLAKKFPTVRNLKLRPTALYALGRDLDNQTLFDQKAIRTILKLAETEWVSGDRAREIAVELQQPSDEEIAAEEVAAQRAKEAAAAALAAETDDILDGPPPELPPAPEATAPDLMLPDFEQAVDTLLRLRTKPLSKFTVTDHEANDIRAVSEFLRQVADATVKTENEKEAA